MADESVLDRANGAAETAPRPEPIGIFVTFPAPGSATPEIVITGVNAIQVAGVAKYLDTYADVLNRSTLREAHGRSEQRVVVPGLLGRR